MLESNEFIVFLLSIPAFVFMLRSARSSDGPEFRHIGLLKLAFGIQMLAWFLTNIEVFLFSGLFNCLEHICEAASAIILLMWLLRVLRSGREKAL